MPRYKLTLEYDGSGYAGWQKQIEDPSIQQALETAVAAFCGEYCKTVAAGRTDAGVHATGQVVHVDLPKEYDPFKVMQGINFHMMEKAPAIAVIHAEAAPDTFHARFSATRRFYRYRIINRRARLALELGRAWHMAAEVDVAAMQRAVKHLLGTHDFTSFRDSECQAKSPIKTLDNLDIMQAGDEIIITTDARSFLHHQVRIMAGTLMQIGIGRFPESFVTDALAAKNRASAGPTAPAEGLYLVGVSYPATSAGLGLIPQ